MATTWCGLKTIRVGLGQSNKMSNRPFDSFDGSPGFDAYVQAPGFDVRGPSGTAISLNIIDTYIGYGGTGYGSTWPTTALETIFGGWLTLPGKRAIYHGSTNNAWRRVRNGAQRSGAVLPGGSSSCKLGLHVNWVTETLETQWGPLNIYLGDGTSVHTVGAYHVGALPLLAAVPQATIEGAVGNDLDVDLNVAVLNAHAGEAFSIIIATDYDANSLGVNPEGQYPKAAEANVTRRIGDGYYLLRFNGYEVP